MAAPFDGESPKDLKALPAEVRRSLSNLRSARKPASIPGSELTDTHADVEAIWGRATHDLREQLCAAANLAGRFRVLERALIARFTNPLAGHRAVRAALDLFELFPALFERR